ncbi:translation factor [Rhypophila decipiens]|uniref:Threonylcarbamoyl-AMP synthase n=1 Tax=Rhypophila decipiens TaxID=261697 RepID=A0AAN6YG46_9PEZI|nr:translation factor [Rhypophila decipiens]
MASTTPAPPPHRPLKTTIIKVSQGSKPNQEDAFGHWAKPSPKEDENNLTTSHLNTWVTPQPSPSNFATLIPLQQAADYLVKNDIPLAFPTETVYGLGADATRSNAVRGIYTAKGRPSDNPLIVHVSDLAMLRDLLSDPIPEIYHPLITKFWPGPLTILLPNPSSRQSSSKKKLPPKLVLAKEVTAGLPTFGARMPSSALARSLIKLANRPLAAPSANASTKPSPTTAQHVYDDLQGRIEFILDGGACTVGVESTVVDGLCDPPVVLRPGGVSIEELRQVKGWERVEKAYADAAQLGENAPRAPGMKYKHYSPRAKVVLYEAPSSSKGVDDGKLLLETEDLDLALQQQQQKQQQQQQPLEGGEEKKTGRTVAVIRTTSWPVAAGLPTTTTAPASSSGLSNGHGNSSDLLPFKVTQLEFSHGQQEKVKILDVDLGSDIRGVAHGLFAALRELDRRGADVIFVEGVSDADGQDIAAAVMNRLRKAASVIR